MADKDRGSGPSRINENYVPSVDKRNYVPSTPSRPSGTGVQGNHVPPTSGQSPKSPPPNPKKQ